MRLWLHLARICLGLLLLVGLIATEAAAQSGFEQLASPGPLAHHHAQLEKSCTSCHTPLDREAQKGLCLKCHEAIKDDMDQQLGMHGLATEARTQQCNRCHTEHKGRETSLVDLQRLMFDHGLTNFPLSGAHKQQTCASCHKVVSTGPTTTKTQYKGTPSTCISCHQKDDLHKGRLGSGCGDCHTDIAWSMRKPFDHFRLTGFRLLEAHRLVADGGKATCASCHYAERYKGIPHETCAACHGLEDVHNGLFGAQCSLCHNQTSWKSVATGIAGESRSSPPSLAQAIATLKKAAFDHDRTRFPLVGHHQKAKCESCHTKAFKGTPQTCHSCHAKDDAHAGRFGNACQTCHSPAGWKRIVGTEGTSSLLATIRVLKAANFDHAKTRFPLVGHHGKAKCESCHTKTFKDTPRYCHACHARDDAHNGRFGTRCEACHTPGGWKAIAGATGATPSVEAAIKALKGADFDHAKTRFPLTGRHTRATCESCHVAANKAVGAEPRFRNTPRQCIDCHRNDGRRAHGTSPRFDNCARCHNTRGW